MSTAQGKSEGTSALKPVSFVNRITFLPPPPPPGAHDHNSLMSRQSVQFAIYTALGFCVTLGVIILALTTYLIVRRVMRRRSGQRHGQGSAQTAVQPPPLVEPKDFVVVMQPGGYTDVACKEESGSELPLSEPGLVSHGAAKKVINLMADSTCNPTTCTNTSDFRIPASTWPNYQDMHLSASSDGGTDTVIGRPAIRKIG